jgi:hypothetical protein
VLAVANLVGAALVLLTDRRGRRRFLAKQREGEALQGAAAKGEALQGAAAKGAR